MWACGAVINSTNSKNTTLIKQEEDARGIQQLPKELPSYCIISPEMLVTYVMKYVYLFFYKKLSTHIALKVS